MTTDSGVESTLLGFVRDHSAEWLTAYSRCKEIETHADATEATGSAGPDRASHIMVLGGQIELLFAVSFRIAEVRALAERAVDSADDKLASQFVSEYANQVAGRIRDYLERASVRSAISLPLTTHPLEPSGSRGHRERWRLAFPGGSLSCYTWVEWKGGVLMLPSTQNEQDPSGSIEFL